jgi:hypothetical protein
MSALLSERLETVVLPAIYHQLVTLPKLDASSDKQDKGYLEHLLFARLAPLLVALVVRPSAFADCLLSSSGSQEPQFQERSRNSKEEQGSEAVKERQGSSIGVSEPPSQRIQYLYTCVVHAVVGIVVSQFEFPRVRQLAAQVLARFDADTTFGVSSALLTNVYAR